MTHVERSPKRIRALVEGTTVADSRSVMLVWEHPYYPTYYLPRADLRAELVETGDVVASAALGDGHVSDLHVGGHVRRRAALTYPESATAEVRDLVRLDWDAMDDWLEEDEPVYVHPRDPYKRIDVLASSRQVRIVVDGVTVADSTQPRILFETGLVPRYYLPLSHVRTDLLRPSEKLSRCPYKGTASWWSLDVEGSLHQDLAWTYPAPAPESQKITGLVAFYDERVDLYLDGEQQDRPEGPFGFSATSIA